VSFREKSARSIDDERVGKHRAYLSPLLSYHRTHGAGSRVLCDSIRAMGTDMDFELVLPMRLGKFVPVGLLGFLIAGMLAAFHVELCGYCELRLRLIL
jgi:hypothetical protein